MNERWRPDGLVSTVDVPATKVAANPEMPDRQDRSLPDGTRREIAAVVQEPLQKSVDREALLLGF
jgi:hypothetical protein